MSEAREQRGSDFSFWLDSQHGWKPSQIQQNVVTSTLKAKAANALLEFFNVVYHMYFEISNFSMFLIFLNAF